jgi:hypothetical protein
MIEPEEWVTMAELLDDKKYSPESDYAFLNTLPSMGISHSSCFLFADCFETSTLSLRRKELGVHYDFLHRRMYTK